MKWIHLSDICVGILGDSEKANRVIPNKVFQILSRYLFGASGSHILLLTGAFAIAWVAGFLDPGAPAGIGGREAILLKVLTPIYGPGISVGLAISLRMITTLTDGLTFSTAVIAKWKMDAGHP